MTISFIVELAILCLTIEFIISLNVEFAYVGSDYFRSSPKLLYALKGPSPSLKIVHIITPDTSIP